MVAVCVTFFGLLNENPTLLQQILSLRRHYGTFRKLYKILCTIFLKVYDFYRRTDVNSFETIDFTGFALRRQTVFPPT